MATKLSLKHEWTLGGTVGDRSGFGRVYAAHSPGQPAAVAKLVPKNPGAERELLLAEGLDGVRNVVPLLDSGETADDWVLVMPRAEKSLRGLLNERAGPLPPAEAIPILADIAATLADLDRRVVHRDIKPENVLLLDGRWCLVDFGISRYAEATTAPDTRKFSMTPPYAAPEQWRGDRATSATDVYALGVVAFELMAGHRPFDGPEVPDYRDQHLHRPAPTLTDLPPQLAALIEECLFKAPETRPSPANLVARLDRATSTAPAAGLARLQDAHRAEVARQSAQTRAASAARSDEERRRDMAASATRTLTRIADALRDAVLDAAPSAVLGTRRGTGWKLTLHQAVLELDDIAATSASPWGDWQPPAFIVIAHTTISVTIPGDHRGYRGRSHSLWYCDAQTEDRYAWFETAFMTHPLTSQISPRDPFALPPSIKAARAVGPGMAEFQVAWPFTPVTIDNADEFIDRWAGWFAVAAQGQLRHPNQMPEHDPNESWRR